MITRIATYTQSQSLVKDLMRLQSDYAKGQLQESSGLVSTTYQGISSSSQRLLNLESDYSTLTSRSENTQIALDRVNSGYTAVQGMLDIMTSARSSISAAISGAGTSSENFKDTMQQVVEELAATLNTQQAGNYLFGGGVTDTAPVNLDASGYAAAPDAATADTGYYQGGGYLSRVEVSGGQMVTYGVTADNPAFEQALRALNIAISNPDDTAALTDAFDLLGDAYNATSQIQTTLSNRASQLEDQINQNTDDLNTLDGLIDNIKNVDLAEVTVRLTTLETQLEASYSLASKLLKMNLANYL